MSIISEYWQRFQVSLFPHLETVLEEPLTQLKQLYRGYIRFLMAFVMIGTTNLLQPARGIQMDFSLRNPLIGAQPLFPSSTASTALSSLQSLVKPMSDTKQNNGSYYWSFQPNLTAEGPRASVHAISGQYFEYVISNYDLRLTNYD